MYSKQNTRDKPEWWSHSSAGSKHGVELAKFFAGKSTAIIPEMEEPFLLTYGRNGYSDIALFRFLSKVNRTHPACISSPWSTDNKRNTNCILTAWQTMLWTQRYVLTQERSMSDALIEWHVRPASVLCKPRLISSRCPHPACSAQPASRIPKPAKKNTPCYADHCNSNP